VRVQVEGEGEAHVDSRRIRDPFSSQTIPWNMYEVVDLPMCCGARHLPSSRLNLNTNHTVDPSKGSRNACIICSTTGLASLGQFVPWDFQNTPRALALAS
jgi:hypothetical protein